MRTTMKPQAGKILRNWALCGMLGGVLVSSGCETAAGTGALAGSALGAGIGGIVGGRGGALAGAAIGGGTGLLTGAAVDANREKKAERNAAAAVAARAPKLEDLVRMTQSNVPDGEIISQIRNSGAVYNISSEQLIYLNQNGVHQSVISELQATASYRAPRRVYVEPAPVVYVEPPPPAVGVGVIYRR